jgi:hypothetical protein
MKQLLSFLKALNLSKSTSSMPMMTNTFSLHRILGPRFIKILENAKIMLLAQLSITSLATGV